MPETGAIGADLNADHVAVGELDRFGNPVNAWSFPISLYKRSHDQIKASLGNVVAEIVRIAKETQKPIVIEGWISLPSVPGSVKRVDQL